jgi:hypothetical protein
MGAEAEAGEVFDKVKTQAQVVGSGIFSFAQGVTPEVRDAISDAALLAQLHANLKAAPNTEEWFTAYSDVLQHVGWVVQKSDNAEYSAKGTVFEVHKKMLDVLAIALGPGSAAAAIVIATFEALQKMEPDSSWIRIFGRESQKAHMAHFQIGLVEKEEASDVLVRLLACFIDAENDLTQVLFFKLKKANASFTAKTEEISINRPSIVDLAPVIKNKVRAYQFDYLSTILEVKV